MRSYWVFRKDIRSWRNIAITPTTAGKVGAKVLIDEVYLETLFDQPWRSAFHLGPNFVITSSLTKACGIRCGWILAQPKLVERMWQIVDFTYGSRCIPRS